MQCRNCSGNEFRRTDSGNYKCAYCGTLYHEECPEKQTPQKRKILYIAASAAAALVIISITAALLIHKPGEKPAPLKKTFPSGGGTTFTAEKYPEPEGKILSVDVIPDSIGNHYFLVMCKNTGETAIRKPHIIIRLYAAEKKKIASGSGYSFMNDLNPGETTPVLILVKKPPAYTHFETDYTAEMPYVIPENGVFEKRFIGEISDVSLKPESAGYSYRLKGRISNSSNYGAKYVQIAAVLYDAADKAIGYGSAFISEKNLKPGDYDIFDMYIITVTGKPDHYKLYYYGMVD